MLEREEAKKGSESVQCVVDLAKVDVNERQDEWEAEGYEPQHEEEEEDLDQEQVRRDYEEETNYTVKTLEMFEFGSWEEASSKVGKPPTTTKWNDRVRKDVCPLWVRFRPLPAVLLVSSPAHRESTGGIRCNRWHSSAVSPKTSPTSHTVMST